LKWEKARFATGTRMNISLEAFEGKNLQMHFMAQTKEISEGSPIMGAKGYPYVLWWLRYPDRELGEGFELGFLVKSATIIEHF